MIKNRISVLIATKDRYEKLFGCVNSILRSKEYKNIEIIIVDQSHQTKITSKIEKLINDKKIKYVRINKQNKSLALNIAAESSTGEILAFTDDDCVVDQGWLFEIHKYFLSTKNAPLVFGQTKPYLSTKKRNCFCPATFRKQTSGITKNVKPHWLEIGLGNNMAIKRNLFKKIHGFEAWLGPGSICQNGDEIAIIMKTFRTGSTIGYLDSMIVYHNSWIKKSLIFEKYLSYKIGLLSAYSYFCYGKLEGSKQIVLSSIHESITNCSNYFRGIKKNPFISIKLISLEIFAIIFSISTSLIIYIFNWLFRNHLLIKKRKFI